MRANITGRKLISQYSGLTPASLDHIMSERFAPSDHGQAFGSSQLIGTVNPASALADASTA